ARRAAAAPAWHPGARRRGAVLRRSRAAAGGPVFDPHAGGAAVRPVGLALVPRTRSSHDLAARTVANFGIGTLAAATLAFAAPAGAAERLVSSLSSHVIRITPSFVGTQLVLFGIVERDAESPPRHGSYDVVATVKGPPETLVVRRKERVVGIWVNTDSRTFV